MQDAVALVIVGNEILSGKVRDTNSPYLIRALRDVGCAVGRIDVVPDHVQTIADCVRARSAEYRAVFTVGGVGPTLDDVTVEAIALALERPLEAAPRLTEVLRHVYADGLKKAHMKMALVPRGATLLDGPGLRWPQVSVDNVYIFPGTPELLERKFRLVAEHFRGVPFVVRRVFTTLDEGDVADLLDEVAAAHGDVGLGSYPVYDDSHGYRVQLVVEGRDRASVDHAFDRLVEALDPGSVVGIDEAPRPRSEDPAGPL